MKPTILLLLLVLLAAAGLNRAQFKTSHLDLSGILPSLSRPANHSRIFYAVMFDAGSTGTRIHVQHVFDESPFLVPDNGVSIMNGTNEGITSAPTSPFAPVCIVVLKVSVIHEAHRDKLFSGHLNSHAKNTVGILDLGGGSTQITFLPKLKKTIESAPEEDYVARFDFLNSTFELYTHSYLGNGLMAARLATLGALGAEGHAGYKLCYQEVLKVVKGIIHQPYELQDSNVFYAFSYYFDRAVDAGLINNVQGGMLQVRDFKKRAKEVCNKMTKYPPDSPFLCMDLTYITCLLKDGFGFKDSTVLQLIKKVKNVEASWALGAMLDHFHNLKIH
ncbi:hypothetical protein XENOCAPTIV_001944 [Xenoophorus captivus]|uniref:nucleoside diphosphate phosphatase n=1 Tax=Xenoophorus captivus TaxID=1517983 RepID=A0ABV0QZ84_9TELE